MDSLHLLFIDFNNLTSGRVGLGLLRLLGKLDRADGLCLLATIRLQVDLLCVGVWWQRQLGITVSVKCFQGSLTWRRGQRANLQLHMLVEVVGRTGWCLHIGVRLREGRACVVPSVWAEEGRFVGVLDFFVGVVSLEPLKLDLATCSGSYTGLTSSTLIILIELLAIAQLFLVDEARFHIQLGLNWLTPSFFIWELPSQWVLMFFLQ